MLGAALRTRTASEVLALVTGADANGEALLADQEDAALSRAVQRWRDRLSEIPSTARLAAWQHSRVRLVLPGDAEWPTQRGVQLPERGGATSAGVELPERGGATSSGVELPERRVQLGAQRRQRSYRSRSRL